MRVAPMELMLDGFEEGGKAEEDNATHTEIDDETCNNDPPSVIQVLKHEHPQNKIPLIL